MLESCLPWENEIIKFESISDWHIEGLLHMVQTKGKMDYMEPCPQWEKLEGHNEARVTEFKSKSGQTLVVERLTKQHAKMINDHWKFRDETSLNWVQSQCECGLAFGVFPKEESDGNPIAWIITYR